MNVFFRGAWASIMATSSMTMTMFQIHKLLPQSQRSPLPPSILTEEVLEKINLDQNYSSELQEELTMFSHFGYGVLGGVTYAALCSESKMNPLAKGTIFGLAVFAGSYYGLIPGLNLRPTGKQMTAERNAMMLGAHVIWGGALGYAEKELRRRGEALLDGRKNRERLL